jgi:hypothetical protein
VHHENGDTVQWEQAVRHFEHELRFLWERAVEDVVSPVFKRLENKVKTDGLIKLTAITPEDCKNMRLGYGRASALVHSDGASLHRTLPTPQDIEAEIISLKAWLEDIRKRQVEAAKAA